MSNTLSLVSLILSSILAFLCALARHALLRQEFELERRLQELERTTDELRAKGHAVEVAVVRNEGQAAALRIEVTSTATMLEAIRQEMKADMIGRREWEARMNGFEDALRAIREQLSNVARLIQSEPALAVAGRERRST